MGWIVAISVIAIIALMLVAALRTGFSFALSAFVSLNNYLQPYLPANGILAVSIIEAICSVLGIEGYIVASGVKDGMKRTETDVDRPRKIAAFILLAVSCMAGIFQSASLVETIEFSTAAEWVLAFVTGFGVPIAIMFASPYLGMMLNYQTVADKEWLDRARASFDGSKERKLDSAMAEGLDELITPVKITIKDKKKVDAGQS